MGSIPIISTATVRGFQPSGEPPAASGPRVFVTVLSRFSAAAAIARSSKRFDRARLRRMLGLPRFGLDLAQSDQRRRCPRAVDQLTDNSLAGEHRDGVTYARLEAIAVLVAHGPT